MTWLIELPDDPYIPPWKQEDAEPYEWLPGLIFESPSQETVFRTHNEHRNVEWGVRNTISFIEDTRASMHRHKPGLYPRSDRMTPDEKDLTYVRLTRTFRYWWKEYIPPVVSAEMAGMFFYHLALFDHVDLADSWVAPALGAWVAPDQGRLDLTERGEKRWAIILDPDGVPESWRQEYWDAVLLNTRRKMMGDRYVSGDAGLRRGRGHIKRGADIAG